MADLLYLVLQVGSIVLALAVAYDVSRRQPLSGVGVVMHCLDDRVLVTGLTAGAGITVLQAIASISAPALAGSYSDEFGRSVVAAAYTSTIAAAVLLVLATVALSTPLLLMLGLPSVLLRLGVISTVFRVPGTRTYGGPIATGAFCAAIGMPPALAVGFGVAVAAIGPVVRRFGSPRSTCMAIASSDCDMPTRWPGRADRDGGARRTGRQAEWEKLTDIARHQVAAVAAAHLVCIMTVYMLILFIGPLHVP